MEKKTGKLRRRLEAARSERERLNVLFEELAVARNTDLTAAAEVAERVQRVAMELTDLPDRNHLIARATYERAAIANQSGAYSEALQYALEGLDYAGQSSNIGLQLAYQTLIAELHSHMGTYLEALVFLFEAVHLTETASRPVERATLLNRIGQAYLGMGEGDTGLKYLDRALEAARELGDAETEANILISLAQAYCGFKEYEVALEYGTRSLELTRQHHNQNAESEALLTLGHILREQGGLEQAAETYTNALALARSTGNTSHEVEALLAVGKLHIAQNRLNRAVTFLRQALTLAHEIEARQHTMELFQLLAAVFEQNGDYQQALTLYKQFHDLHKTLFNERADARQKSLEITYDLDAARQQAEIYQLMNVSLREEIQEKEQLIAELDSFSHTVAHDLKNPLGAIRGYASLLEESTTNHPDPEVAMMAQSVSKNAEKANLIIESLLLLAGVRKMEEFPVETLDMADIVHEVAERTSDLLAEYSGSLQIVTELLPAMGYAPWVEQVWVNYISNALKYGGNPPVVTIGCQPASDGAVQYWVQDNGSGIAETDRQRIFVPFTRIGQAKVKGHGLGLSIVQRIVSRLEGTVGVESTAEGGSRFWFTLPGAG